MLKNEEICQKYHFVRKDLNDFETEWIKGVAFAQFAKKSENIIATLWMLSTKNFVITAQPGGYHFFLVRQGCFECTQIHIHTYFPSTSQLLF